MKELSIEEKAKRYDEAIKVAQGFYNNSVAITNKGLEDIFPELKESEGERIRQLLIRFVKYDMPDNYSDDFSKEDCLEWLENQGEHKPADKKGMNLVEEEMTPFQKEVFCIIDTTIEKELGLKQVCDKLFALASNEIKQNFSWSEDELKVLNEIIEDYEKANKSFSGYQARIDWIKSLKGRYTWKPSESDIRILEQVIDGTANPINYHATLHAILEKLKKLREE